MKVPSPSPTRCDPPVANPDSEGESAEGKLYNPTRGPAVERAVDLSSYLEPDDAVGADPCERGVVDDVRTISRDAREVQRMLRPHEYRQLVRRLPVARGLLHHFPLEHDDPSELTEVDVPSVAFGIEKRSTAVVFQLGYGI